jgi:hypothetical protein
MCKVELIQTLPWSWRMNSFHTEMSSDMLMSGVRTSWVSPYV